MNVSVESTLCLPPFLLSLMQPFVAFSIHHLRQLLHLDLWRDHLLPFLMLISFFYPLRIQNSGWDTPTPKSFGGSIYKGQDPNLRFDPGEGPHSLQAAWPYKGR